MENETISTNGTAVKASGNCQLELRGVTISYTEATAIKVLGNANVSLIGGSVTGDPAIDATGNAKVYLAGTETEGPIYRIGRAYIGERPAAGADEPASLGSRRPGTPPEIEIDGLVLEVTVNDTMTWLSSGATVEVDMPAETFELEQVIDDLDARRDGTDWSVTLEDTVLFDFDTSDIQSGIPIPRARPIIIRRCRSAARWRWLSGCTDTAEFRWTAWRVVERARRNPSRRTQSPMVG